MFFQHFYFFAPIGKRFAEGQQIAANPVSLPKPVVVSAYLRSIFMVTSIKLMPTAVAQVQQYDPAANDDGPRVLVVGAGPVGLRFAHELLRRQPNARLILFGDEPHMPYNRMQLSALLAGTISYDDIMSPLPGLLEHPNFSHINTRIARIDTDQKCIFDERGTAYFYDDLVLATGSRPHIPNIPGIQQTGVYTFRNLKDAEVLYNRITRARHVVIVGGGLLGLEAACALQRANTLVTVIQQGPRLLDHQLDDTAASYLSKKVEAQGISVITNSGVRQILGEGRATGVVTRDGDKVICDTVLLCAGIKPATDLARLARLKIRRGVLVDDSLQTSTPCVYAIGECCEHKGKTYGLVNPGLEQAAIAADVIAKGSARYTGSLEITQLKVLGQTLSSMGEISELTPHPFLREWAYHNKKAGIYRKLITLRGRLIGAVGYGDWPAIHRVQEALHKQQQLLPWQILRFWLRGYL
jgi:nitrite reductase (NADH) large subunit